MEAGDVDYSLYCSTRTRGEKTIDTSKCAEQKFLDWRRGDHERLGIDVLAIFLRKPEAWSIWAADRRARCIGKD
jgi:hypothetical protein